MMIHRNTEAQPNTSAQTATWLQKRKWEDLQHPSYSPDRAPSDFYLFGPFRNFLSGQRFEEKKHIAKNSCAILYIPWKGTLQ
jgi:hypothetical protein